MYRLRPLFVLWQKEDSLLFAKANATKLGALADGELARSGMRARKD
jgi:hypothetical protein